MRIIHLLFSFPDYAPEVQDRILLEELTRGTIAKELIEGLKMPLLEYAPDHYHGGGLIYGLMTVPFFLLFGKSIFVLRLPALFFQLGIFLSWHYFLKRFFGEKPAFYFALLYLFSLPWLTWYGLYATGAHAEALLFPALSAIFLFSLLYDKRHPTRDAAFLGLLLGFGTYFTYGTAVSAMAYLLFWRYEDHSFFKKKPFYIFMLFFVIGFSPWFIYNSLFHYSGVDRIQSLFVFSYWERLFLAPLRFVKRATYNLFPLFTLNYRGEGPHVTLFSFLYYGIFCFSVFHLIRLNRQDKKIHFFFIFPFLFLWVVSLFQVNISTFYPRYFLPLYPFIFSIIALHATALERQSRQLRRLSHVLFVFLLLLGLKGEMNLLSRTEWKRTLHYRGYSYRQLAESLIVRYPDDLQKVAHLSEKMGPKLNPRDRFFFYMGFNGPPGRGMVYDIPDFDGAEKYFHLARAFNPLYQPFFLERVSVFWGADLSLEDHIRKVVKTLQPHEQPYALQGLVGGLTGSQMKSEKILQYRSRWMKGLSAPNRKAIAYALGKLDTETPDVEFPQPSLQAFQKKITEKNKAENSLKKDLLPHYHRGLGAFLVRYYDPYLGKWPADLLREVKKMDPKTQEAVLWGIGFDGPRYFEDPYEFKRMKEALPSEWQSFFMRGLSDRLAWGGENRWFLF